MNFCEDGLRNLRPTIPISSALCEFCTLTGPDATSDMEAVPIATTQRAVYDRRLNSLPAGC